MLTTLICAGSAAAQTQLVTNPSFEGGLTGWTQTNSGACTFLARSSGAVQPSDPSPAAPADGANYANIGPTNGGQTCYLYQDITVPSGQTTQLTFAAAAGFSSGANTVSYAAKFEVVNPTTSAVLATPYQRDGTQGSAANFANFSLSLTPYAGQTIRLRGVFINGPDCCNDAYFDNVLAVATPTGPQPVPTLSEWAMILFGLGLAGGAAVLVQRRRQFG